MTWKPCTFSYKYDEHAKRLQEHEGWMHKSKLFALTFRQETGLWEVYHVPSKLVVYALSRWSEEAAKAAVAGTWELLDWSGTTAAEIADANFMSVEEIKTLCEAH